MALTIETPLSLEETREIERYEADDKANQIAEQIKAKEAELASTGLLVNGPSRKQYDYDTGIGEGMQLQEAPEGGYNLPNKHVKNNIIAGYRPDGSQVVKMDDPQELGKKGAEGLRNSFTNTVHGAPAKDYEHATYLAAHHIQNGGAIEDFDAPVSEDMKQQAFGLVDAQQKIYDKTKELENLPEEDEPVKEVPTISLEEIHADKVWGDDIAKIIEWKGLSDEYADSSPEDISEDGIQELSALKMSFAKMASLVYAIESGDMPEDVKAAYARVLTKHEALTNVSKDVLLGWVAGVVDDAPMYAAGGGVGTMAARMGTKTAATKALMKALLTPATRKGMVASSGAMVGAAGGVEGALFGATTETMHQAIAGEGYDTAKIGEEAKWGAVGGAMIGSTFGAALSKPGREGIVAAYNNIKTADFSSPGKIAGQRGHVKFHMKKNDYTPPTDVHTDMGVPMADTMVDSPSYVSRAANAIQARWVDSFGKNPTKEVDPAKVIESINAWQKKPKPGQEFSGYELENMGVLHILDNKVADGKKVTMEEVEDIMWANRPRVNVLVSSQTDRMGAKSMYYTNRRQQRDTSAIDPVRRGAVDAVAERVFDVQSKDVPVDPTPFHEAADRYYARMDEWTTYVDKSKKLDGGPQNLYPEDALVPPKKPRIPDMIGEENVGFELEVKHYAQERALAAEQGVPFDKPKPQLSIPPRTKYVITNKVTGEVKEFDNVGPASSYAKTQSKELVKGMSNDEVVATVLEYDAMALRGPMMYSDGLKIDNQMRYPMIVPGKDANNYREMRLMLPYDGVRNLDNIAEERFGAKFDMLEPELQARVKRTQAYAVTPDEAYMEEMHFPLEMNRLSHARMQDIYLEDGRKVLGVMEMQSDMAKTAGRHHPQKRVSETDILQGEEEFRKAAAETDLTEINIQHIIDSAKENVSGDVVVGKAGSEELPQKSVDDMLKLIKDKKTKSKLRKSITRLFKDRPASKTQAWQPTEGMREMTVNRIMQYAEEEGYESIAIPVDREMIKRIQLFDDEAMDAHAGMLDLYHKQLPKLFNDKKLKKRWGITNIAEETVHAGEGAEGPMEKMLIIHFDHAKADGGRKAIYGSGAVATGLGVQSLKEGEEQQGGDI